MKITAIQNGVTMLDKNGSPALTDRDCGIVGDRLVYGLTDGAHYENTRTGERVPESFFRWDAESEFATLLNEFEGEDADE